MKHLEENVGRTLFEIVAIYFIKPSPSVMEIKIKINKLNLIKFKIFCTEKKTMNKIKRQSTEWEKIFANNATNEGLISNIYKHLIEFNIKKSKKKWVENLNRCFSKEYIQLAKSDMKRHSTSLIINANLNYYELSPHASQNGHYQEVNKW